MAFADDANSDLDDANKAMDKAGADVDAAGAEEIGGAGSAVGKADLAVANAGEVADAGLAKAESAVDVAADAVGIVGTAANEVAGAAIGVVDLIMSRIPASLTCIHPCAPGVVPFDFNPEKIKMSRTSSSGSYAQPELQLAPSAQPKTSGGVKSNVKKPSPMKIIISGIIFEGPTTKWRCDTLLAWMNTYPVFPSIPFGPKRNRQTLPAELTFMWGLPMFGFMYQVKMTSCSVNYVRFSGAGIPLRAEIDITMEEQPSPLGHLPTNPTSGGLPGRRSHTVAHGETLQSIAMDKYGTPGLWRRIAEVNGIKDPARVRPGRTVYLPNPEELATGSQA
jgi:nucleoid-associated protein YgaU